MSRVDRVLNRLGFSEPPRPDLNGLRALYAAWCLNVPFDNVRKFVALRTPGAPLPGSTAEDFFEHWLAEGAGGTCWSTSNALFALARAVGFDARRVAGSMRDTGIVGHGTVKVRVEGRDWLVDTSLLWGAPVPVGDQVGLHHGDLFLVEVEPVDGTHRVWFGRRPGHADLPCRLLVDPADDALYAERHEASRERSPFNYRLYAQRNRPGEVVILNGRTRSVTSAGGAVTTDLSRDELCAALRDDIGISASLVSRWVDAGGLEAAFDESRGPRLPEVRVLPPSLR